jgi:hypothetical protein
MLYQEIAAARLHEYVYEKINREVPPLEHPPRSNLRLTIPPTIAPVKDRKIPPQSHVNGITNKHPNHDPYPTCGRYNTRTGI